MYMYAVCKSSNHHYKRQMEPFVIQIILTRHLLFFLSCEAAALTEAEALAKKQRSKQAKASKIYMQKLPRPGGYISMQHFKKVQSMKALTSSRSHWSTSSSSSFKYTGKKQLK